MKLSGRGFLAGVTAVVALVSCASSGTTAKPVPSPARVDTHGWLAWLSHGAVSVREPNGSVRQLATVPSGPLDTPYSLRWSADGRALAWLENSATGTAVAVYSLDAAVLWRSSPKEFPTDRRPARLAALGAGFAALGPEASLHEYVPDRRGHVETAAYSTSLTPGTEDSGSDSPDTLVGLGDRVLVEVPSADASDYGGPEGVATVDAHGTTVSAWQGEPEENLPVFHAAYDGTGRVASVTGTTAGGCEAAVQFVDVRDTRTWRSLRVPALPSTTSRYYRSVNSLDYGSNGLLVGTFELRAVPCTGKDREPEAWVLRAGAWHRLRQTAQWAAYGPNGQLAVLRPSSHASAPDFDYAGTLLLVGSRGTSVRIAPSALEAQWSP